MRCAPPGARRMFLENKFGPRFEFKPGNETRHFKTEIVLKKCDVHPGVRVAFV